MFLLKRFEPVSLVTFIITLISTAMIVVIFVFLVIESYPIMKVSGFDFFTELEWYPPEDIYGALPMIYGTFLVSFLAITFSFPFALGSAIYVSEFMDDKWRPWMKGFMELLAGVPSIVYGLIGMTILSGLVKETFLLSEGNGIFTASILLGIMILPTVMSVSEDAIHSVPHVYREASLAVGYTRMETVISSVLPQAVPALVSATLLGMGRAMGETMAVMLVIGSIDKLPTPLYNIFSSSQTMTSKLGREAAESMGSGLHWNALVSLGLIMFVAVALVTLVSEIVAERWREKWVSGS